MVDIEDECATIINSLAGQGGQELNFAFCAVAHAQSLLAETQEGDFPGLFVSLTKLERLRDVQKLISGAVRKHPQTCPNSRKDWT